MASEATVTAPAGRPGGRSALNYLPWVIAALTCSLVILAVNLALFKYAPKSAVTRCLPALDCLGAFGIVFLLLAGMGRVRVLMGRELATYFQSPLAAVVAGLFFIIMSLMIYNTSGFEYVNLVACMDVILMASAFWMMFVSPIITMRLLAEEKSSGAMEILVTDPVTDWDIVLGKFLAALLCLVAMVLPLGLYVVLFAAMRKPTDPTLEWGVMASAAIGLACVLALFAAVGLLASSLTKNQVVSALVGVVALMALWLAGWLLPDLLGQLGTEWGPRLRDIAKSLSLLDRLHGMAGGQLDLKSIFFFLSTTALVLYFSVRVVESRKWR